jgi:hypothetical protein
MNPLSILLSLLLPIGLILQPLPVALGLGSASPKGQNLLSNGDFARGTEGWELIAFGKKGKMSIDTKELHAGKPTLRIDNFDGDHCFVRQILKGKPNTRYRLSGYIKTRDVKQVKGSGKEGAALLIGMTNDNTLPLQNTTGWRKVSIDFVPEKPDDIRVGATLGTYARPVSGIAWFADITLTELGGKR